MPEAVIVDSVRTPIGRAFKGSLKDLRPDDTAAFILDALVSVQARRHGIGTRMIEVAAENARANGCRWLHADFEQGLDAFYFASCGFVSSPAGLIALQPGDATTTRTAASAPPRSRRPPHRPP